MALLRLENVTKRFGGLVAVDKVNLEIQPGELIGIVGPNGSGKT
ncbi:MAG: ABC transporter ATP-binding protein, partial [Deltaproteobacteria bacterium]